MSRSLQHLRSHAGTSFTKAVQTCCVQMRPVSTNWNKTHTGAGSQA